MSFLNFLINKKSDNTEWLYELYIDSVVHIKLKKCLSSSFIPIFIWYIKHVFFRENYSRFLLKKHLCLFLKFYFIFYKDHWFSNNQNFNLSFSGCQNWLKLSVRNQSPRMWMPSYLKFAVTTKQAKMWRFLTCATSSPNDDWVLVSCCLSTLSLSKRDLTKYTSHIWHYLLT